MREDYDFSKGKRGAVIATPGKKRITIYLDADVIDSFQKQAEQKGVGYQTLINAALREASRPGNRPASPPNCARAPWKSAKNWTA